VGLEEAPTRRLVFERDSPRLPRPLPRYLPPDTDRRLVEALEASPNGCAPTLFSLHELTGVRIGELLDLELDAVMRSWAKVRG